jgi:hypothetical protein
LNGWPFSPSRFMAKKTMDFDDVRKIALALPGVEPSTIHGAPSLKVRGKLLTCPTLHRSVESNTLAVRIDRAERARLMEADPGVYYVTDHYRNYPTVLVRLSQIDRKALVLVRLSQIDRKALKELLRAAWRFVSAPPKSARSRSRRGDD